MSSAIVRLSPKELQTPLIACPTVLLAVSSLSLWSWSVFSIVTAGRDFSLWHWCVYVTMSSVSAFACFTPAHDATHFAIGRKTNVSRLVNEGVGRLCAFPLLAPFCVFRHVHLLHHKYTNNKELDPDYHTQGGILCCLFLELHYYVYLWKHLESVSSAVLLEGVANFFMIWGGVAGMLYQFGFVRVFWAILLPQRLAALWLAYTFDRVPHRGAVPRSEDPCRSTKRITGFFAGTSPLSVDPLNKVYELLLRVAIVEQDAHVVHHLFPTIPFYSYHAVWNNHMKEFYKAGVENTTVF